MQTGKAVTYLDEMEAGKSTTFKTDGNLVNGNVDQAWESRDFESRMLAGFACVVVMGS